MGAPPVPSPEEYARLETSAQLHQIDSPHWEAAADGRIHMTFPLPLHGVSLIRLTW
jgi:hypothetical protein